MAAVIPVLCHQDDITLERPLTNDVALLWETGLKYSEYVVANLPKLGLNNRVDYHYLTLTLTPPGKQQYSSYSQNRL